MKTGSHTVLVFVKVQFLDQWSRFSRVQTLVVKGGQLLVVTEDENSAKTTFWFMLQSGHEVWITDDIIHIPALCLKSAPGDYTKCRG